jgi:hypothetical protein
MALGTRVQFDAIRTLGFAAIGAAYAPIGAAFVNRAVILTITNTTDVTLTISFGNGVDNVVIPTLTTKMWNFGSNSNAPASQLGMAVGTIVSVKGTPGSGSVYVEVAYNN